MKRILFLIFLIIMISGCIDINPKPEVTKFYGTWMPCSTSDETYGYFFDSTGELFKALTINGEIYYTRYCNWELQEHVLVLCHQRLNYKFDNNKLYLYDFQDTKSEKCYYKVV